MKYSISIATLDEIKPYVLDALQYDTTAGSVTLDDCDPAANIYYKCTDETGVIVGGYVMSFMRTKKSKVAWIEYAAGKTRGVDFVKTFMPLIELQAKDMGADQVAMVSRRAALINKLHRAGYVDAGLVLRKKI
jgi:hypothetical protein